MNRSPLLKSLCLGLVAPALYFLVRSTGESLGYSMYPMFVSLPNTFAHLWPVVPGTIFLAYHLAAYLEQVTSTKLVKRAALMGMGAGLVNTSLSVLLALIAYAMGHVSPSAYSELLQVWASSIPTFMLRGAPIALTLGLFFGLSLAWLEIRGRNSLECTRHRGAEKPSTI